MAEPPTSPQMAITMPRGFLLGGVTSWSVRIARRLANLGVPVRLVSHRPAFFAETPGSDDVGPLTIPAEPFHSHNFWRRSLPLYASLAEQHARVGPTIFLPNYWPHGYAVAAAVSKRTDATRVIGYCHAHEPEYYQTLVRYSPIVHRFVAVSRECQQELVRRLPDRADDIVMMPYGVDIPETAPRTTPENQTPLRLLYAGRIVEAQKRVSDLIRLAQRLGAAGVDFSMTILGDGAAKPALERDAGRLPDAIRRRVLFQPGVTPDQMPGIMQRHHVAVLVSEYEGTSVFMLEALAHGLVPVVTRVSGVDAVIDHGENGFAHPIGDLNSMAASLQQLDRDRALYTRMSRQARQSAEPYGMDAYTAWFHDLMKEVAAEEPRVWPAGRRELPLGSTLLQATSPVVVPAVKSLRWALSGGAGWRP